MTPSVVSRVDKRASDLAQRGPGPRSSGSVLGARMLQPVAANVPKPE